MSVVNEQTMISNGHVQEEREIIGDERVTLSRKERFLNGIFRGFSLDQVAEEFRLLTKIVYPVTALTLLHHLKSVISMLYLGHLGNSQLAGGSLAIAFANITGISVIKGLSTGMEPLCCQAYGAKKLSVITQTFQRMIFILLITAILITTLWLNMEPILLLLKQDEAIIQVANLYLRYSILDLILQVLLPPLRIFLRSQNITKPVTIITLICLFLHIGINYILVIYFELGVKGVAIAGGINTINIITGIIIYINWYNPTIIKPWDGFKLASIFQGLWKLLILALESVIFVCLEFWWYEIMLFLCGILKNPKTSVAAMGILIQTTGLIYVFPHSLSVGLSTRVGHELGAREPQRAKRASILGFFLAMTLGVIALCFTIVVRPVWGKMFTSESSSDPSIISLVSTALPIVGLCELGNCPQTVASGVLTGSARPRTGAVINGAAFYLVGLPVAIALAFPCKYGFVGLWYGLAAAQAACVMLMIVALIKTDWKKQVNRSEELTRDDNNNNDDDDSNDLETSLIL